MSPSKNVIPPTVMKIGSSTISIKPAIVDNSKPVVVTTNDPPPLAPLSVQSHKTGVKTINPADSTKVLVSPSQKIAANKMLVDLLDKKAPEPPVFGATTIKRKIDMESEVPSKKSDTEDQSSVAASPKAADLYAKLAGSILDSDEEMEDEIEKIPTKMIEKKVTRQIIMGPNNQMMLSPPSGSHQTTATIKTDSGIQTVPIILQNNAIQGQTIIQQPAPTQYILATNQQGQTYVVAQQPMPQPQQILHLAQNPNQQGTKTIIILQQGQGQQGHQQIQVAQQQGQQQKIIMTPNGQQVIYSTQRQFGQQQVIGNFQQGTTFIQSGTTQSMTNRKIVFTNTPVEAQTTPGGAKIVQQQMPGQNIIVQKGQKFQIGNTQISQVIQPQKVVQPPPKTESPPVAVLTRSKSPSPVAQPEVKVIEPQEVQEVVETPKESPSTSGTSSPAPSKQQVSIQIPVPQSQISGPNSQQYSIKIIPSMDPAKVKDEEFDANWPFVCDWRGCPRKKFANANEVYLHACAVHCPSLDGTPDLFCQWGGGSSLCDNLPRKRFSLMTHIFDRHCTADAFKMAVQKRTSSTDNSGPKQPYPVTLIRQPNVIQPNEAQNINLINGPTNIQNAGAAAMQAIKRHSIEFNIVKEQMVRKSKDKLRRILTES